LILIEYDGEHHFKQINHYHESHFKDTVRNDSIKNNFALKGKIPLLRIAYTEFNKIEDIIWIL
jgi:hypothetical protein